MASRNFVLKKHTASTIRNMVIAVFALIVLFIAAGVAYVRYSERHVADVPAPNAPTSGDVADAFRKPAQPGPNAPEGVALSNITSPVLIGSNSSVTVSTNATSTCTITVTYNNVPSKDSGLVPKVADQYGNLTWTWTVDSSVPVGTWPIKVTCVYHGRSGMVEGNVRVTK